MASSVYSHNISTACGRACEFNDEKRALTWIRLHGKKCITCRQKVVEHTYIELDYHWGNRNQIENEFVRRQRCFDEQHPIIQK